MAPDAPDPAADERLAEGLRERKKRLTRQLLSDTATAMFLEKGFDGFRVTDVAEACGVSEKTVYNYFPTKESLILDREEDLAAAIRLALGPDGDEKSPVRAILDVLDSERQQMRAGLADVGAESAGLQMFRRFFTMLDDTPQLVAASIEMLRRLARVAAEALAERAGVSPDDPEPAIAGYALVGLWDLQFKAMRRFAGTDLMPDEAFDQVAAEVARAARLIDTGLWSFAATAESGGSREQFNNASDAAQHAGRQVAAALKQARKMWSEMQAAHAEESADAGANDTDWGDWRVWAGAGSREHWREMQREMVQQWREAQREHAQQWREAHRAYADEQRDARRHMKEEVREAARAAKEAAKQAARQAANDAKRQAKGR